MEVGDFLKIYGLVEFSNPLRRDLNITKPRGQAHAPYTR